MKWFEVSNCHVTNIFIYMSIYNLSIYLPSKYLEVVWCVHVSCDKLSYLYIHLSSRWQTYLFICQSIIYLYSRYLGVVWGLQVSRVEHLYSYLNLLSISIYLSIDLSIYLSIYVYIYILGILKWFEVSNCHVTNVSPVEFACESVQAKNTELRALINQYSANQVK